MKLLQNFPCSDGTRNERSLAEAERKSHVGKITHLLKLITVRDPGTETRSAVGHAKAWLTVSSLCRNTDKPQGSQESR